MSEGMVGRSLGRYHISGQIGAGGMGVVYRARDTRLERDVAIKILPPGGLHTESARRRFRQEALALSKLNHAHIATVYDFDSFEGMDFVVMEYIAGVTLFDKLRTGALREREAVAFSQQIAEALECAHEHGILHRDLKPANIMVTPKGQVKVLDFGLAQMMHKDEVETALTVSASEPQPRAGAGTIPYMAPEQLRQEELDERCDIWAAGAVLYEMTTGQRPFPETVLPMVINSILNRAPKPPRECNPELSFEIERMILKALEKDPNLRYQSAKEFLVDHLRLSQVSVSSGHYMLPPPPVRTPTPLRGISLRAIAMSAGFLVAFLLAIWGVRTWMERSALQTARGTLILIGEFENRTGEAILDRTLRELLSASIEQSREIRLYPSLRVAEGLKRMERPPNAPINETLGVELCQREDLRAVVLGTISRLGNSYLMGVRAVGPRDQTLMNSQAQVEKQDQIPAALDKIARELRARLGEVASDIQEHSAPLAQVTSPSLQAVKYFTQGKESLYNNSAQEAAAFFQKAVEADPGFAMAHEYLGVAYGHIGDPVRREQQAYQASLLVAKVSESERLKILGDYSLDVDKYDTAAGYYQALAALRPQDPAPLINLALCYKDSLDFAAAIKATQKVVDLIPHSRVRDNLANHTLMNGDPAGALKIIQAALQELPDDIYALQIYGNTLMALGRFSEARTLFDRLIRIGGDKAVHGRTNLADLELTVGQYAEARRQLEAGITEAEKQHNTFIAWQDRIVLAETFGTAVPQAGEFPPNPDLLLMAGTSYIHRRQWRDAENTLAMVGELAEKRGAEKLQSFRSLLRAEMALAQNHPADAVEAAEQSVHYMNSTMALEVLGHAYAAAGRDRDAVQAYEQVLARAAERATSYDAPAFHRVADLHYRAGVICQKLDDQAGARKHLQAFLAGSQPDAGLSTYEDARTRLANLRPLQTTPTR